VNVFLVEWKRIRRVFLINTCGRFKPNERKKNQLWRKRERFDARWGGEYNTYPRADFPDKERPGDKLKMKCKKEAGRGKSLKEKVKKGTTRYA